MKNDKSRRILIVDDDQHITRGLKDLLKFNGYEVEGVFSGEEGLKKVEGFMPDLILLDLNMPGIGGIGFLRRIMDDNGKLPYPTIVFTARTTAESFFRDVAVDGFITKPCDENELLDLIRKTIGKNRKTGHAVVLVGEDEPLISDQLEREFTAAGYLVEHASTGPEVIEKAASVMPEFIVLKKVMTGLNGDAVASLLQNMPGTRGIPVVLYDADSVPWEEELCPTRRMAGVRRFVGTQDAPDLLHAVQSIARESG